MTTGKAASQAGHAFLDAFIEAPPENRQSYLSEHGGTKVVLSVDSERRLREIFDRARNAALPCSWITEEDGTPLAVGIGPALRRDIHPVTKRLSLMR